MHDLKLRTYYDVRAAAIKNNKSAMEGV
jgi:hypothetical protein